MLRTYICCEQRAESATQQRCHLQHAERRAAVRSLWKSALQSYEHSAQVHILEAA